MYQCDVQGVPCFDTEYFRFDEVCRRELANPISVDEIINESSYCQSFALDLLEEDNGETFLNLNDHLTGLNGKMGVYHLWVEIGNCQDHQRHSLLCVYVGKGFARSRVQVHMATKWPKEQMLYVSFYECDNRIAKYLEQLFLDTYDFYLNKGEKFGAGSLYARWTEDRLVMGTELYAMAEIHARKFGDAL